MTPYQFSLITPQGRIFHGSIESLIVPGAEGSLGIMAGHAPIVAALKNGALKLRQGGTERFYAINGGTLEVNTQTGAIVLTDSAVEQPSWEEALSFKPN